MNPRPPVWTHLDLGLVPYDEARALQCRLVAERRDGIMERDLVIFLEHPPVFTLGRRGRRDHLTVTGTFLESRGVRVILSERGGDITYHGPGQLVVYPILDLRKTHMGVREFVTALEEVMIRTAADQGIRAERNDMNRGVWVGQEKLGSVGIAIRRGVTFHGLALNVNTDLEPFSWIHPCGLEGIRMTSMARAAGREIPMEDVRRSAALHMEGVFGIVLDPLSRDELGVSTEKATRKGISRTPVIEA